MTAISIQFKAKCCRCTRYQIIDDVETREQAKERLFDLCWTEYPGRGPMCPLCSARLHSQGICGFPVKVDPR